MTQIRPFDDDDDGCDCDEYDGACGLPWWR